MVHFHGGYREIGIILLVAAAILFGITSLEWAQPDWEVAPTVEHNRYVCPSGYYIQVDDRENQPPVCVRNQ